VKTAFEICGLHHEALGRELCAGLFVKRLEGVTDKVKDRVHGCMQWPSLRIHLCDERLEELHAAGSRPLERKQRTTDRALEQLRHWWPCTPLREYSRPLADREVSVSKKGGGNA